MGNDRQANRKKRPAAPPKEAQPGPPAGNLGPGGGDSMRRPFSISALLAQNTVRCFPEEKHLLFFVQYSMHTGFQSQAMRK
jgi:hypothetical protein